jgi:uncharacterized protein YdeI (YjbR/CyaY-like superfamily)
MVSRIERESGKANHMSPDNQLFAAGRAEWHQWLTQNHDREREIRLIFYKKDEAKRGVLYEEAIEEALCFGWVDSIVKKIDEQKYVRKSTPRKKDSQWSDLNIARVRKLIADKRMTAAGLAKFKPKKIKAALSREEKGKRNTPAIPHFIKRALLREPAAYDNFLNLPPSHRRNYINWICDARKEETRLRRLGEAIGLLKRGERLGMK